MTPGDRAREIVAKLGWPIPFLLINFCILLAGIAELLPRAAFALFAALYGHGAAYVLDPTSWIAAAACMAFRRWWVDVAIAFAVSAFLTSLADGAFALPIAVVIAARMISILAVAALPVAVANAFARKPIGQ
ncbi:hypothetical protein FHS96_004966 [Sphingomonas zeicaulis]|uniref:hypothetical protein n=1 Tax=Sphingomonas zeicaulis TaxID=1632740 RepID=UPI003D22037E